MANWFGIGLGGRRGGMDDDDVGATGGLDDEGGGTVKYK